uniref:Restriction endonuclease n=1 Tax=Caulobacter sp. (strain K31) TaxID=366602 RepID=B0T9D0_CAUSK
MAKSRYDALHDRFAAILSGKAGTRYERLTAMTWKALEGQGAEVVHDVRLRGASGVDAQIDVVVKRTGGLRRVLIECKDFDAAKTEKKVGVDVVRQFRAVIEDVGDVDAAHIVTCNGFTRAARLYAARYNIGLAVLKAAQLAQRVGSASLDIGFQAPLSAHVELIHMDEANQARFAAALETAFPDLTVRREDQMSVVSDRETVQFADWVERETLMHARGKPDGIHHAALLSYGAGLSIAGGPPIPFDLIAVRYNLVTELMTQKVVADQIAELVLTKGEEPPRPITDRQLRAARLDRAARGAQARG